LTPVTIDESKPTVVIKGWYISDLYHHGIIETADGMIQPVMVEHYGQEVANRKQNCTTM